MLATQARPRSEVAHQGFPLAWVSQRLALLACLTEGRGAHPSGQVLAGEHLPRAVVFILDYALAKIREQAGQLGQGQGPPTGEIAGAKPDTIDKPQGEQTVFRRGVHFNAAGTTYRHAEETTRPVLQAGRGSRRSRHLGQSQPVGVAALRWTPLFLYGPIATTKSALPGSNRSGGRIVPGLRTMVSGSNAGRWTMPFYTAISHTARVGAHSMALSTHPGRRAWPTPHGLWDKPRRRPAVESRKPGAMYLYPPTNHPTIRPSRATGFSMK